MKNKLANSFSKSFQASNISIKIGFVIEISSPKIYYLTKTITLR